jgi:hypothetical protein
MDDSVAYILSRFFLYGAYATPIISFIIVRKTKNRDSIKLLKWMLLTIVFGGLFLVIAMLLFLKSGKVT